MVESGCWEWTGPLRSGYGHLRIGKSTPGAHRYFFERLCRPLEPGEWVLHHCDNPKCVNPAHLYAGTYRENIRDRKERYKPTGILRRDGRKLSEQDVRAIRQSDAPNRALAKTYGVGDETIRKVRLGESYKHVEGEIREYEPRKFASGVHHHSNRLQIEQVRDIKRRLSQGASASELAREFAVDHSSIRCIKRGRSWRGVTAD